MPTKFIGIKDFRQNMAEYAKLARAKTARFVVMNRNVPMFEVAPFNEKTTLETFFSEIEEARTDVREGRIHSQEEVLKKFG
jgi:hypothetical protein